MPVNYRRIEETLLMLQRQKTALHDSLDSNRENERPLRSDVHTLHDLRVAVIMDEFSRVGYEPECTLLELVPASCVRQVQAFMPDFVFIESVWYGKDGLWTGKFMPISRELISLIVHCRTSHIPVVFWNKEDPVFTAQFLPVARLCDMVFTTDMDCIPVYQRCLGHQRVYHLHFAAQPRFQNPIETEARKNAICFAGGHYCKYPERNALLWRFVQKLDGLMPVEIYDRYRNAPNSRNAFPEQWSPYIVGELPFSEINRAYKGYLYNINMNSSTQSPSMFARRVFELMASNTLVISNYARGLLNYFGDLVVCTDDADLMAQKVEELQDERVYRRRRLLALRRVLGEHLYEDRLDAIVQKLFGKSLKKPLPKIYVYAEEQEEAFQRQTYANRVLRRYGDPLPDEPDAFAAVFSGRHSYGDDYLLDLILSTRYSDRKGFVKPKEKRKAYQTAFELPLCCGVASIGELQKQKALPRESTVLKGDYQYTDEFNFSLEQHGRPEADVQPLILEGGMPAETVTGSYAGDSILQENAESLFANIPVPNSREYSVVLTESGLMINSRLESQAPCYIHTSLKIPKTRLPASKRYRVCVTADGSQETLGVAYYFTENMKARRAAVYFPFNQPFDLFLPEYADMVQFAFRLSGSGRNWLHRLEVWGDFSGQLPDIAVIIPTYKPNDYFADAIASVQRQDYPPDKVRIIVAVNGPNHKYYEELKQRYAQDWNIIVAYTERTGVNAGRNLGLSLVRQEYLTFLDDDDFFTTGYLRALASGVQDGVTIIAGRVTDADPRGNNTTDDTYINRAIAMLGSGICNDLLKAKSLFCTITGKLYRTSTFLRQFGSLDESFQHTEDVLFWACQFGNIKGKLFVGDPDSREACVRRLTQSSLSRPVDEHAYQFYITDRIKIIRFLARLLVDDTLSLSHKKFVNRAIKSQTDIMYGYFARLDVPSRKRARECIENDDCCFLNKSRFSQVPAIAFCHNFSPYIDASAFMAAKRLPEIDRLEGVSLNWQVVSKNMSNCRKKDYLFEEFYASYRYSRKIILPGKAFFSEKSQWTFGTDAYHAVETCDAKVIYSRSLWAGSHMAAWLYKQAHPTVKWYAEFSDPLYKSVDGQNRQISGHYEKDEEFLNNFWYNLEQVVYSTADVVIFTNENQRDYMLSYYNHPEQNPSILAKSLIWYHPVLPEFYCHIVNSAYALDAEAINIGYFGTFYANRSYNDMLTLLENPKVTLHLFSPESQAIKEALSEYDDRVRINPPVSHLEVLNLCTRMDYLYLNDVDFNGAINPYRPSKYADYCTSNTRIIALVKEGGLLYHQTNPQLIQIQTVSAEFAKTLVKKVEFPADPSS